MFDMFRRREVPSTNTRISDLEVAVAALRRTIDNLDADLAKWKKREGRQQRIEAAGDNPNGNARGATDGPVAGFDPALHHPNPRVRALHQRRRAGLGLLPATDADAGGREGP